MVFVNRKLAVNSQSSVVACWTVTDKFVAVCAAFLPDEIQYTSNQFIFEGVIEKWWDIFSDSVETSRSYVLLLVEKKLLVQASCVCCKVKYTDIAVHSLTCHTATGTHMPYRITQCYLPPDRVDIPALTPAEASTRFSNPGGMQG